MLLHQLHTFSCTFVFDVDSYCFKSLIKKTLKLCRYVKKFLVFAQQESLDLQVGHNWTSCRDLTSNSDELMTLIDVFFDFGTNVLFLNADILALWRNN